MTMRVQGVFDVRLRRRNSTFLNSGADSGNKRLQSDRIFILKRDNQVCVLFARFSIDRKIRQNIAPVPVDRPLQIATALCDITEHPSQDTLVRIYIKKQF